MYHLTAWPAASVAGFFIEVFTRPAGEGSPMPRSIHVTRTFDVYPPRGAKT